MENHNGKKWINMRKIYQIWEKINRWKINEINGKNQTSICVNPTDLKQLTNKKEKWRKMTTWKITKLNKE